MSKYWQAIYAIIKGLGLCLGDKKVRRLAMIPWGFGAVCYIGSVYAAYRTHPILLKWAVGEPSGFWMWLLYGLAWLLFGVLLLVATLLISMTLVIVFTSVFQTDITIAVLQSLGRSMPEMPGGVRGALSESSRAVAVEAAKLLWLVPLMGLLLIVGLIPLLTPFALALGAWLLAYQFVDIVLDVYRLTARGRFRFAKENTLLLIFFGGSLSAFWAVPLLGILLPPAAVAGAAWLLSETNLLDTLDAYPRKLPPSSPSEQQ